jgi:prefoldin subunit 5
VDVFAYGWGLDLQKKCDEGIDFCKRKMDLLKKNSEAIVPQIREKQEMTNQVNKVYQMKMQQQMAEQAQGGGEAQ